MNIHIPLNHIGEFKEKALFILTRPFYHQGVWENNPELKIKWHIDPDLFHYTTHLEESDCVFLPRNLNYYIKTGKTQWLKEMNAQCAQRNIRGYAYIEGDFGEQFLPLSHFVYFRMGGFKSQLDENNQAFPASLNDYLTKNYQTNDIAPLPYSEKPIVGFCGQATNSTINTCKQYTKFIGENIRRFVKNPFRSDYEPLFISGMERANLLKQLEASPHIQTNFIYREQYRGGAVSQADRDKTTREYYDNLRNAQYVLCLRGGGNFSIRFYETLLMGRIPIFVNTDCLLPFENEIDWKKQVVWVEWHERNRIAEKIVAFHQQHTPESLAELQQQNRDIWMNRLSLPAIMDALNKKQ